MINEFTSNSEFKRVVEEQQIKGNRLKHFLKRKGIILLNNKAKDLAQASYTIFLGSEDLSELQELMQVESNYQKSTMLVLTPVDEVDEEEETNIVDTLLDEVNRYKTIAQGKYVIDSVNRKDDNNLHITFTYEKKVSGKMKFISTKKKTVNVHVESISESKDVKIDIRQTDSGDSKEFISFLESLKGKSTEENEDIFNIKHITLDNLEKNNKIEFFDLVSKKTLDEWRLVNITGISVKKNTDSEENLEVVADETEMSDDTKTTLVGITSAVLKGNGLRTNEFVQTCINEGFIITAMKFKYNHKSESKSIVVEINFSNSDIRIDIDKTYLEEEGREYITPLSFSEQDETIKLFQNIAYIVYNELLEKQREEALAVII